MDDAEVERKIVRCQMEGSKGRSRYAGERKCLEAAGEIVSPSLFLCLANEGSYLARS